MMPLQLETWIQSSGFNTYLSGVEQALIRHVTLPSSFSGSLSENVYKGRTYIYRYDLTNSDKLSKVLVLERKRKMTYKLFWSTVQIV